MRHSKEAELEYWRKYREAHREKIRGYEKKHEAKRKALGLSSRPRKKEHRRKNHLWSRYRIRPDVYVRLLSEQNGRCALCGVKPTSRPLTVDHCHETNRIRGLLCTSCNAALGKLGDNEAGLLRALKYIRSATDGHDVHSS